MKGSRRRRRCPSRSPRRAAEEEDSGSYQRQQRPLSQQDAATDGSGCCEGQHPFGDESPTTSSLLCGNCYRERRIIRRRSNHDSRNRISSPTRIHARFLAVVVATLSVVLRRCCPLVTLPPSAHAFGNCFLPIGYYQQQRDYGYRGPDRQPLSSSSAFLTGRDSGGSDAAFRRRRKGRRTRLYDSETARTTAEIGIATAALGQARNDSSTAVLNGYRALAANNNDTASNGSVRYPSFASLVANCTSSETGGDAPRPTENGGFTHTLAARAKISAANKGKRPWNKGRQRSEEVRAKISAGVRARNRERLLRKLEEMGLTEEEYKERKREERRQKDAERRARRTENGGYRPTQETKDKISRILKEKYARGEVKPRSVDPDKVRRGFTHSEETRAKIAASLKKRWATDPAYRANMLEKSTRANTREHIRKKISESLRKRWQDPQFRSEMLSKFASRKKPFGGTHDSSHREKISAAMKAKWQDEEYRKKTLKSIANRKAAMKSPTATPTSVAPRPQKPNKTIRVSTSPATAGTAVKANAKPSSSSVGKRNASQESGGIARAIEPLKTPKPPKVNKKPSSSKKTTFKTKVSNDEPSISPFESEKHILPSDESDTGTATPLSDAAAIADSGKETDDSGSDNASNKKGRPKKKNGNVDLLKEERRDLYDLLYGDDDDVHSKNAGGIGGDSNYASLGDENLDNFDPYGLENF